MRQKDQCRSRTRDDMTFRPRTFSRVGINMSRLQESHGRVGKETPPYNCLFRQSGDDSLMPSRKVLDDHCTFNHDSQFMGGADCWWHFRSHQPRMPDFPSLVPVHHDRHTTGVCLASFTRYRGFYSHSILHIGTLSILRCVSGGRESSLGNRDRAHLLNRCCSRITIT